MEATQNTQQNANGFKFNKAYLKRTIWIGLAFFGILLVWQLYNSYCSPMLSLLFVKHDFPEAIQKAKEAMEARHLIDPDFKVVLNMKNILAFGGLEQKDYLSVQWKVGIIMALDNIAALFIMPLFGRWSDKTKSKSAQGEELLKLISNMSAYYNSYNNPILGRIPAVMLRGMVRANIHEEDFDDQAKMNEHLEYLSHYLVDHAENYNIAEAKDYKIELKYNAENSKYNIKMQLADDDFVLITPSIVKSNEYKRLKTAYPLIREYLIEEEDELLLETDTETVTIKSFEQLHKILDDRGSKGLQIQRFKGLGEMMPQQLWETTMDPSTRTLLKVNLEDAMLCDQLFDILMGDKVEPRRDFIQAHAVYATNIDA